MKKTARRAAGWLLALSLLLSIAPGVRAAGAEETADWLCRAVSAPGVGSVGGEWAVLGLARGGFGVPEDYFSGYLARAEAYVRDCGGVLHARKYTEYSRVVLALTALGVDARSFAGYDLTAPLGDFEKTVWQGLNGAIWALLALDSAGYPMPEQPAAAVQATRQRYVDHILDRELPEGGWSLSGSGAADPDVTAMALQALAKYRGAAAVDAAVERALARLSVLQNVRGGWESWGTENAESCAQVIVALCELGVPLSDARFVKNGVTALDALGRFRATDGGFRHDAAGSGSSLMAAEQALYALAAAERAAAGKPSLYRMDDALALPDGTRAAGLAEKHPDVRALPVSAPGTRFSDTADAAVEALAARGILSGSGGGRFEPERAMTRAEFASMMVRGLGLRCSWENGYADVPAGLWYSGYVGTASRYGVIRGFARGGETVFDPTGTITRQEAAVMLARAAALCGLDTASDAPVPAGYADWARDAAGYCLSAGMLAADAAAEPLAPVTRGEMARMLHRLLTVAELL